MTVRNVISRTLAVILFSSVSAESIASEWPKTEAEFAVLPPYCKARVGSQYGLKVSEAEIQKWKRALGPGFNHVHHFCAGLNTLNIMNKNIKGAGKAGLTQVLIEFEYTQTHAPNDFPLRPRISVEKGKVLLRLNRSADAISEFQRAMKLKPRYTSSYAALSDYYKKIGLKKQAKDILEEGLKHSPNSKKLKRRLEKL